MARFPGCLAVLEPVRHARGILASVATSQLNMSPWRPFPGLFVAETVDLGRFRASQFPILEMQRPQCCCCAHRQAPLWLLHTSTSPIVLLYNSNSPCVATTHSCVATTHSLCGFHTETGVRVRVWVRVRAARGKVWSRGVTHTHPRSLPRAAGGKLRRIEGLLHICWLRRKVATS